LGQHVELAFSLANSLGLDQVDQLDHLTLQFHQLSACLPKASVGFGTLLELSKLCGLGGDIPRTGTAAIGEDFGLM
jgi:hypothetical protein